MVGSPTQHDIRLDTVTVNATRACHWMCPECGTHFEAKVIETTRRLTARIAQRGGVKDGTAEYERWKTTPVADVPELPRRGRTIPTLER